MRAGFKQNANAAEKKTNAKQVAKIVNVWLQMTSTANCEAVQQQLIAQRVTRTCAKDLQPSSNNVGKMSTYVKLPVAVTAAEAVTATATATAKQNKKCFPACITAHIHIRLSEMAAMQLLVKFEVTAYACVHVCMYM